MRKSQIQKLKLAGLSADAIYRAGAGELNLFGVAFYGHKGTTDQRRKLNRLWRRVCIVFGF